MRLRITLLAAVVTAVAVAAAGWLLLRSVEDTQITRLRDQANESVDLAATRLADGATVDGALVDLPSIVFVTDEAQTCVASNPSGALAMRCTGVANPAFDLRPGPVGGSTGDPAGEAGFFGDSQVGVVVDSGENDADVVSAGHLLQDVGNSETISRGVDSARYGTLTVTAVAPVDTVARGVESVGKMLWVLFPGLVGVVAVVAWWLTGRALRPVEAIRAEAEAIRASSLHRRVPEPDTDDEVGRLARTMNAMLDRLEGSAHRQRQFVSDASHELRTPVTAIRTDLEVALAEGDDADWPRVARAVLSEEERLESLLADLLVLAADDEDTSSDAARSTTTDMAALLVDEAARRWPVPVGVVGTEDADTSVVAGAPSRLRRAVANLVDNATRHAAAQVEITLTAEPNLGGDPQVVIHVDDDGPGVPIDQRERIFERFVRLDASRSRDHGGAGLGLSVVDAVVARAGGSVTATDSPLGGARFTIRLPRSAR